MIYLASRSPRRRELLLQMGVRFEPLLFREGQRQDEDTDEAVRSGEQPDDYVRRVTRLKAEAAWKRVVMRRGLQRKPVLAADTTVALAGEILGKPADRADADRILRTLSGTQHRVLTAIALAFEERLELAVSESLVTFAFLDDTRIASYVQSGEPFDKAGAYAIQGRAGAFVSRDRARRRWSEALDAAIRALDREVIAERLRLIATEDVSAELRTLRIPIVLMQFEGDLVIGRQARDELEAACGKARIVRYRGPHFAIETQPRETAAVLREPLAAFFPPGAREARP